ncbi:MAG: DUF1963 domain-containing protein [Gallionellaceae bacterium]|jgi:uncharacterized protein YwqG
MTSTIKKFLFIAIAFVITLFLIPLVGHKANDYVGYVILLELFILLPLYLLSAMDAVHDLNSNLEGSAIVRGIVRTFASLPAFILGMSCLAGGTAATLWVLNNLLLERQQNFSDGWLSGLGWGPALAILGVVVLRSLFKPSQNNAAISPSMSSPSPVKNEISSMNSYLFWIVLLASGGISMALTVGDAKDVVEGALITGLFWFGTLALAWLRWVGGSLHWIIRAGASIIALVLFWTAYQYLGRTDVFMCGCKGAASSFWPLVFLWLGGLGLVAFIVSLSFKSVLALFNTVTSRSVFWWLFVTCWTIVCSTIFVRNINTEVLWESLRIAGLFILVPAGIVAAFFAIVYALGYPSRRRIKAMLADLEQLSEAQKLSIVGLMDSNTRRGDFLLCYQCTDKMDASVDTPIVAQIGGNPACLPNESWPLQEDGTPSLFLLQIPLAAPRLPALWQGIVISVFMQDWNLFIRSYSRDDLNRLISVENPLGEEKVEYSHLSVIALPYVTPSDPEDEEEYEHPGIDTEQLLEDFPELKTRLESITKYPAQALAWILSEGKSSSPTCLDELGIQVGGNPYYIQNEHDAHCEICGKPMCFLFQFDDAFGSEFLLGDAGMGYVYGCDDHPEHCQGFIDCY